MDKDKGFRRRAITLSIIVLVTSAIVAVYMTYGVHARSNLPLIVPKNAKWFYHFQTKEVDEVARKSADTRPPYYDSLYRTMIKFPVFHNVKDAGQPGIYLMSDLVLFADDMGWYAALTVTSDEKLKKFTMDMIPANLIEKPTERPDYTYVKAKNRNLYFAFKHKACVFFIPADTTSDYRHAENAFKQLFSKKNESIYNIDEIQNLYDQNCQVVFWGEPVLPNSSHGINLSEPMAKFFYIKNQKETKSLSPLMLFSKAGLHFSENEVSGLLKTNNAMKSVDYLNQTFRVMHHYLKPFSYE